MKRTVCIILCAAALLCLAACTIVGKKGAASLYFYPAPRTEEEAFASGGIRRSAIEYVNATKLREYVNAVEDWTDDNAADRLPFTFSGEFMFDESGTVYYFTEDGTVYYDHYYGALSDEGRAFLLGLRPAE